MSFNSMFPPKAMTNGLAGSRQEAEMFAVEPRVAEFRFGASEGTLGLEESFLKVSSNVRTSAVKMSDDGKSLLVRVFNPAPRADRQRSPFFAE